MLDVKDLIKNIRMMKAVLKESILTPEVKRALEIKHVIDLDLSDCSEDHENLNHNSSSISEHISTVKSDETKSGSKSQD